MELIYLSVKLLCCGDGLEHCGRHNNTVLVILCEEVSKAGIVSWCMESFSCLLLSDYVTVLRKDICGQHVKRICTFYATNCRSQWPRGLRRGSAAARLLGLWVRIPPGAWMSVSCECCVLSGRGLCVGLITRPEESYRM